MNSRARHTTLLLIAAVLLALSLSATSASAAVRGAACKRASGDTVAQSKTYRIYKHKRVRSVRMESSTLRLYSCRLDTIRLKRHRLGTYKNDLDGTVSVSDAQIAGGYALVNLSTATGVAYTEWMLAVNLKSGKRTVIEPPDDQEIGDTFITGRGGVLWVYEPGAPTRTLHAYDSTGDHLLATGDFSEPAAGGSTAYWTQGGTTHSYMFVGAASK